MGTTNKTSEILVEAGYKKTDNRSYFTKALNKVINDGHITIQVMPKGKIMKYDDGIKANLIIKGYKRISRVYLYNVNPNTILRSVGDFIKHPIVAERHLETISVSENCIEPCAKCKGKGYIPLFSYYCGGLCFDCYGSKYMIVKRTITV